MYQGLSGNGSRWSTMTNTRQVSTGIQGTSLSGISVQRAGSGGVINAAGPGGWGYGYGVRTYGIGWFHPYFTPNPVYFRSPYEYAGYWDGRRRFWGSIDGQLSIGYTDPPEPEAEPAPPLTSLEIAEELMRLGEFDAAIAAYRDHLADNPEDADGVRALGIALFLTNQQDAGSAMIRMAYGRDPSLSGRPLTQALFGSSQRRMRNAANAAVRRAHRLDTASAWLTVTVLMQAEGRERVAGQMLERAVYQYLEPELATELRAALNQR